MTNKKHIGFNSLYAERRKLLCEYDILKDQLDDDPVKVEHGIKAEAHFRKFLEQFLPKKFGVTKGYIITPNLEYEGSLEEWDIIIYDALESPVLFVRQNEDDNNNSAKRGIPVEYVRAVIEVKATFNKTMAKSAAKKLHKLRQFIKNDRTDDMSANDALKYPFTTFAVFYETNVSNIEQYLQALSELTIFGGKEPLVQFAGGLILRGENWPNYSSGISMIMGGSKEPQKLLIESCEACEAVPSFDEHLNVSVYSTGYGENEFWNFLMNLVHFLNGQMKDVPQNAPINFTASYGQRNGERDCKPLFNKDAT